jgi:mannose/cellobiose epimerase-like protein (N-acyl-D-glucosamine 2-epimerase family)
VLGRPNTLLLDLYRCLFEYSVRFGWDRRRGGYYESGPLYQSADRRSKIWWVQAEALLAAMQMYRLTGERFYFDCASRTLDWIVGHQVDWQSGEWHHQINQRGVPQEDKASAWKDPYHNGRAVLDSLELLSQITAASALPANGPLVEHRTAQPGSGERLGGTASGSQAL